MQKVRNELIRALKWESAHLSFRTATKALLLDDLGKEVEGIPHTIWQLTEHVRIAQKDIVDFSVGEGYRPINWPEDYWPESKNPDSAEQWKQSLEQIEEDRQNMVTLIEDDSNDLFKPFPHGDGQHLFREAVLLIDHESYHTGQIVLLRKALGLWD